MIVDVALYQDGSRVEGPEDISDLVDMARRDGGFVWLGLAEPSQAEFDMVVGELNFHPLAVEDAISANQRPKIEDYDGLTFFVLKTVFFDQKAQEITTGELMCFIDSHFIVTVRHGEGHPLSKIRHELEEKPDLLQLGPFQYCMPWSIALLMATRILPPSWKKKSWPSKIKFSPARGKHIPKRSTSSSGKLSNLNMPSNRL